ncbi:MAG: hypothetical protein JJU45_13030 [Acidimicrobiia bacterium]|nr:hypothetical protein [Acidimicrobiia bacterium]
MADERAAEGVEHLQRAAMEMIDAARAFLDVAESVVADRERVADVVATVGAVADAAVRSVRTMPTDRPGARVGSEWTGATDGEPPGSDSARIQHIRVS